MKGTQKSLLFIFALLLVPTVQAQNPVGQVIWVKGTLKATQPKQAERQLIRRAAVFEQDTLITDKGSTGQIAFTDSSLLSLRENTTLTLTQYQFGKNIPAKKNTFVTTLAKGGFRTITGAAAKNNPDGYQARTPVATIGVTGTGFDFLYSPANKHLAVNCQVGTCNVFNPYGKIVLTRNAPYATVTCSRNAQAEVACNLPPQSVKTLPPELKNSPQLVNASFNSHTLITTPMTGGGGSLPPTGPSTGGGTTTGSQDSSSGGASTGSGQVNSFSINQPCS